MKISAALLLIAICAPAHARQWDLRSCIEYARENNIQVQTAMVNKTISDESLLQAKASRFPSLSASSSQGVAFSKNNIGAYSGTYSIGSNITIFNGLAVSNGIKQAKMASEAGGYEIEAIQNNIEISVTRAYLNILYSRESVRTALNTIEAASAQYERAKEMYAAGAISQSDFAQIEAQYSSDKYQLAVSESALASNILVLKQLLELDGSEEFEVLYPEIGDDDVLNIIPSISEVFDTAIEILPDMKSSRISIESSRIGEKTAALAAAPSISASAGANTGHYSGIGMSFGNQLYNNLTGSVGLNISIPIYSNRSIKTGKAKARLQTKQAELSYATARKNLYSSIEGLYQDVISAQSRYRAALDKLNSSQVSYNLSVEKFNEGMINPVELLSEKNIYISAQQELLQAKYEALLCQQLLNFYMGNNIEI